MESTARYREWREKRKGGGRVSPFRGRCCLLGLCAAGLAPRTRNCVFFFVLHLRFTGCATHGVDIDLLGEFGELFVGFFFLVQGLLKKILRFALAQQAGPRSYAAISVNFVVFDYLRRRNESG